MTARGGPPLSQHFLHDDRHAARIAAAVRAPPDGRILEIGPGEGALTRHLVKRGAELVAVELDRELAADLAGRWGGREDVAIVRGDALAFTLPDDDGPPWHVVGNLPYAITSPLVFHWLDQAADGRRIAELVFMIQREVAERLTADPGTKVFGALTVGVGLAASTERLFDVPPGAFRPPPSVVSSVVRIVPRDRWAIDRAERDRVRELVRGLFGQRRKQLQKGLRVLGLADSAATDRLAEATGIDLARRPETLSIAEWIGLTRALAVERKGRPG